MPRYFAASITGWIAAILLACEILLPFLLRKTILSRGLGLAAKYDSDYLLRMWPHYWAGYLIAFFSLTHATLLMGPALSRVYVPGLWAATAGISGLFVEVLLGLVLRTSLINYRRLIRRWHFWLMVAVVASVALHIWWNG